MFSTISKSSFLIISTLIAAFFLSTFESAARRNRRYYPEQTRARATELMRTSPELCDIMGLEPIAMDTLMMAELQTHSEDNIDPNTGELTNSITETSSSDSKPVYRSGAYTKQDVATYVNKHIDELDDTQVFQLWTAYITESEVPEYTESGIEKNAIADAFMYWLGTPYRFGGLTEKGIDCSAFVREVFRSAGQMELPRTARMQYKVGEKVDRDELMFGDMIFFKTSSYASITHVGIYLSDDLFVHASSRQGVTVSSLNSRYYSSRYRGGRRVTVRDLDELTIAGDTDFLPANIR
jgi:probable lipoprotein NlpC